MTFTTDSRFYCVLLSLIFMGLLSPKIGKSQNLVPNPSFETTFNVPCGWVTVPASFPTIVANWNIPTQATSDIHSTQIPQNCWNFQPNSTYSGCWPGPQMPRTGNVMAGIYTFTGFGMNNWREYIQVRLSSPMVVGVPYLVDFYASLADYSQFASNNIGIYLSTTPTMSGISWDLPFTPTINRTAVLSNSLSMDLYR